MNEQQRAELRQRVDDWVAGGALETLVKETEETRRAVREAFRLDHETLSQPMTI